VLLDLGDPLIGRLLTYDALEESFRTFTLRRTLRARRVARVAGELVLADYDEHCMPHPRR